jgi:hypothetical protein
MAADMVVLQERVVKSVEKMVDIALVNERPGEEGEIFDIEEILVIEHKRLAKYWANLCCAVQQSNDGCRDLASRHRQETVVIERKRMVKYWTNFSCALQQNNNG